jgi:hypothetical protein
MLGTAALMLNGCASISDSFKVTQTVLVKVPRTEVLHTKTSSDGWHFRYVLTAPRADQSLWYVAWNNKRPVRTGLLMPYWLSLNARAPEIADATRQVLGFYPTMIEPNRTFTRFAPRQAGETQPEEGRVAARNEPRKLVYGNKPKTTWPQVRTNKLEEGLTLDPLGRPVIDPVWHLRDNYSELATARRRVGKPAKAEAIRIGHLDNGYDNSHEGLPEGLAREKRDATFLTWGSLSNAVGRLEYEQYASRREEAGGDFREKHMHKPQEPGDGEARGSHGLGTMGILAGGRVTIAPQKGIAGYTGYLGGAPHARVVPVRVAPWVISLNTAELAYAIDYASNRQKCDVISMSHGGAPTQTWADAVNAAYERGTAIFAAEGDFFSLVGNELLLRPSGIFLPASPVYPAAFRRVVGVTGVASDGGSYGKNWYWRLLLQPWKIASWSGRGSYGADGTSTLIYRPSQKPDRMQVEQQGRLRPNPIAAYAPNVPWLVTKKMKGRAYANYVDLDGGGTSASTPQVAAAAALWLQQNRAEIVRRGDWYTWRKAEAVYQALLRSADRSQQRNRSHRYLGAGQLKANRALNLSYDEVTRANDHDLRFAMSPQDHADGRHSVWNFFGLGKLHYSPEDQRADLWQVNPTYESRETALARLYYNMGLLREWHGGDLPLKKHESIYWKRAKRRAAQAPPPRISSMMAGRAGI